MDDSNFGHDKDTGQKGTDNHDPIIGDSDEEGVAFGAQANIHGLGVTSRPISAPPGPTLSGSTVSRPPNPRVYSEQEVQLLYELGRLFLENGELRKAEVVFKGIVSVDASFTAAWLGLAYLYHYSSQIDDGIAAAKKVVQLDPGSVEGSLFLVIFLYSSGEISAAGAILGEIREKVESGLVKEPNILRIYRSQLERFSSR